MPRIAVPIAEVVFPLPLPVRIRTINYFCEVNNDTYGFKFQITNFKFQINSKLQCSKFQTFIYYHFLMFVNWNLAIGYYLEFGACLPVGKACNLEFLPKVSQNRKITISSKHQHIV